MGYGVLVIFYTFEIFHGFEKWQVFWEELTYLRNDQLEEVAEGERSGPCQVHRGISWVEEYSSLKS